MTSPLAALSALKIKNAAPGKLSDGGGLILIKREDGGGAWVWRYTFAGISREMGLGSFPAVTLADARKARAKWAAVLETDKDPITERKRERDRQKAQMLDGMILKEAAEKAFLAKKALLRGDGERGRWYSPIELHILPKLGNRRLTDIHQSDIADTLRPIWETKHPTAEKAIQRLGIIIRWAVLSGFEVDPLLVDKARHMLGAVKHVPEGITATPWRDLPNLYKSLSHPTAGHRALRMTILTCARTDSVRGMRFDEIEGTIWTVPGSRMKSGQPFRYPLTPEAMRLVEACREYATGPHLFPSYRGDKPLTEAALLKALNAVGEAGRPHGFRTSFRTWVQETNACSYDVAETVLAHSLGNKVERSYARSDLLDQRRAVMLRWSKFVAGDGAVVVELRA
jgi:integrase